MTIYGLYQKNGLSAGFWIQHRTWQNVCAYVRTIAGRTSGGLPGDAPAFDGAPVELDCFDVRSGRVISIQPFMHEPQNHGFVRIAEPAWHHLRA